MGDKSAGGSMLRRRICALGGMLAAWGLTSARPASAEVRYTITDLGPGGAYAINDAGQVVGDSNGPAFLWNSGVTTYLGFTGVPHDVNNSLQVVGDWYAGWTQAVLWEHGQFGALGTLGGPAASARGINDLGQIVGWADNPARQDRAFLYSGGVMTDLGAFGGPQSWAFGINELGQVVGAADTDIVPPGDVVPISRAFLYGGAGMVPIAGDYSIARDINDTGQVVGIDASGGFLWQQGVLTNLPLLAEARAINNASQVVGWGGMIDETDALLWENGVTYNLNDLIPPDSGWGHLQVAADINDAGQIVGWGVPPSGAPWHAFLLTPVPEAGTWVLLLAAASVLLKRTR